MTTASTHRLPAALQRALTSEVPGSMLPPGPKVNAWARAGARPVSDVPSGVGALLDALWASPGPHLRPDGTPTGIPRRPVPSAGACYPVQTHLVLAEAGAPSRFVYDHDHAVLLRRPERPSDPVGTGHPEEGTWLVLTVLPGRSFARYRHRAWPLWIADAAYALAAAEFALGEELSPMLGPAQTLRALLGVAGASESSWWLAQDLVPEIPLAACRLPLPLQVDEERLATLTARRCPPLEEFATRSVGDRSGSAAAAAEEVATRSGQGWVRGADRVEVWTYPSDLSAEDMVQALWAAHLGAARLLWTATHSGRWRCRPVSGIPAARRSWIVHALAMLAVDGGEPER